MNVEIKIDQAAVEQQLVSAILNSAIGKGIDKAISDALVNIEGPWDDRKTLVDRCVRDALQQQIALVLRDIVKMRETEIRALVAEKLTVEVVEQMASVAIETMFGRLKLAVDR